MEFEVIGEMSNTESIAAGKGLRDRDRLHRVYGESGGESRQEPRPFDCPTAMCVKQKCIGTKLMASVQRAFARAS